MKIPGFMLPDNCTITTFNYSTPSGPVYNTATSHKCRIEKNFRWSGSNISNKDKVQVVGYTALFVNYASNLTFIPNDSLVTIEGDSYTYTVVDFKKVGGFSSSHWELILQ